MRKTQWESTFIRIRMDCSQWEDLEILIESQISRLTRQFPIQRIMELKNEAANIDFQKSKHEDRCRIGGSVQNHMLFSQQNHMVPPHVDFQRIK